MKVKRIGDWEIYYELARARFFTPKIGFQVERNYDGTLREWNIHVWLWRTFLFLKILHRPKGEKKWVR